MYFHTTTCIVSAQSSDQGACEGTVNNLPRHAAFILLHASHILFLPPCFRFLVCLAYPNDLRSCLAQSTAYLQVESNNVSLWLTRLRWSKKVAKLRNDHRADLVQLFGYFDLCGRG